MKRWPYLAKIEPISQDAEAVHPDAWARELDTPARFLAPARRVPHYVWEFVWEPSLLPEASHPEAWAREPEFPARFLAPARRVPYYAFEFLEPSLFVEPTMDA